MTAQRTGGTRSIAIMLPRFAHDHGAQGEQHAFTVFEKVVRAVGAVSPLVEIESLGTMVMAARGPARYFGGETAVARTLHDTVAHAVAATGVQTPFGVGIAGSRFAATAAAHLAVSRGAPCTVAAGLTQQLIDGLPVRALARVGAIDPEVVDLLERLGLHTCARVRDIGEPALIDRFGVQGGLVWRLVTGDDARHLVPGAPPQDFAAAVEFDEPLRSVVHVVAAARDTVQHAVDRIAGHGQQCVRLMLSCQTDHGETTSRVWAEPNGFGSAAVVQRLAYQLEGWLTSDTADPDAPTSGIVRVDLVPLECRQVLVRQPLLWGGTHENAERAARALAMAQAVHERVRITVPRWEGGRDVVTAYSHVPVSVVDITDEHESTERVLSGRGVARDWSGSVPAPSPASVAVVPVPATVCDATGHTVGVTGRHELDSVPARVSVSGHEYRVERTAGPWPVEERWWDPRRRRRHVRMQALVRNARGAQRVFLLGLEDGSWHLLGRYD